MDNMKTVSIPQDATWRSLIQALMEGTGQTEHDMPGGIVQDDHLRDEAGKTFEVLQWHPGHKVTRHEVEQYFDKLGAKPSLPAFVVWTMNLDLPDGEYVCLADHETWSEDQGYYVPTFRRQGHDRSMDLRYVQVAEYLYDADCDESASICLGGPCYVTGGNAVFIAFRVLSS